MSEARWTPGPWCADDASGEGPWGVFHVETGGEIACPIQDETGDGACREATANAHLIAAAPDLAEALEDLIGIGEVGRNAAEDRARAALAKARGEGEQ